MRTRRRYPYYGCVTIKLFEAQDKIVRKVEPPDPNRAPEKWTPPQYQKPFADDTARIEVKTAKRQLGDDGSFTGFPGRRDIPAPELQRSTGTMQTTPKGFDSDWSGDKRGLPFTVKK